MKESFCSIIGVFFSRFRVTLDGGEQSTDAQLLQQQHLTLLVVCLLCIYHYYIQGHSFQVTQCLFKLCQHV